MVFRVPKIKTCCCCASLETGAKIIGIIHTLLMIALIVLIATERHAHSISVFQAMMYETIFLDISICSVLMLYGVFKRVYYLIFPWILMQVVLLLFLVNYFLTDVAYLGLMDYRDLGMVIEIIFITIMSYSTMVVYNFYRELKEQSSNSCGE